MYEVNQGEHPIYRPVFGSGGREGHQQTKTTTTTLLFLKESQDVLQHGVVFHIADLASFYYA